MTDLEKAVVEYSIKRGWGHIPSALTQVQYLRNLRDLTQGYYKVAGKPFGAQGWYVAMGVESAEPLLQPPYVDFNVQTLGHALGYSIGVATGRPVWLNISDASLELGDWWEALGIWPKLNPDLFVTVDCNGFGCKGPVMDIDVIKERIDSFGVPCIITNSENVRPFKGIALVDTSCTLGAKLKALGLHYTKFSSVEEFNETTGERLS